MNTTLSIHFLCVPRCCIWSPTILSLGWRPFMILRRLIKEFSKEQMRVWIEQRFSPYRYIISLWMKWGIPWNNSQDFFFLPCAYRKKPSYSQKDLYTKQKKRWSVNNENSQMVSERPESRKGNCLFTVKIFVLLNWCYLLPLLPMPLDPSLYTPPQMVCTDFYSQINRVLPVHFRWKEIKK